MKLGSLTCDHKGKGDWNITLNALEFCPGCILVTAYDWSLKHTANLDWSNYICQGWTNYHIMLGTVASSKWENLLLEQDIFSG